MAVVVVAFENIPLFIYVNRYSMFYILDILPAISDLSGAKSKNLRHMVIYTIIRIICGLVH